MKRLFMVALVTAALLPAGCGGEAARQAGEDLLRGGAHGAEEGGAAGEASRIHPGPIRPVRPIRPIGPDGRLHLQPPAIDSGRAPVPRKVLRVRARLNALAARVGANKRFTCTVANFMLQPGGPPHSAKALGRYLADQLSSQFAAGFVQQTYDTAKSLRGGDPFAIDDALCTSRPRYGGRLGSAPNNETVPLPPPPQIKPYRP